MAKQDDDLLSPEHSPSLLEKAGVRRVNQLPLLIGLGLLTLVALVIAGVAVKRAHQQQPTNTVTTKESTPATTHLNAAKEVIGARQTRMIPEAEKKVAPQSIANQVVLPVAVEDFNVPPMPRDDSANLATEAERIRQEKFQLFVEAVKAKTAVEINRDATYKPNEGTTHDKPEHNEGRPVKGLRMQQGSQDTLHHLGGVEQEARWQLQSTLQQPSTPYLLRAGALIPGIMVSGIRSDLPGQIIAQISQNVYDTATGRYLLIPQGTRLYGLYSTEVSYGQQSLFIAWQRLTFPDGQALDIGSMPGVDSSGYAGFRDEVHHHYFRVFGSALLMSGIVGGFSYSQNQTHQNAKGLTQPTASSALSQALGQQLGEVTAQMIAKNLSLAPDLKIRPGYPFNVMVVKDITFKTPYQAFHYRVRNAA